MMLVGGEVRRIADNTYNDKSGKPVVQPVLILEPESGTQNIEVFLTAKQAGQIPVWESLKGKRAFIQVRLYVNHEYRFYKLLAVGDARPLAYNVDAA